MSTVALAAIVGEVPGSYAWWALYGFGATINVLGFTVLNDGFASELAGRANTALNLLMFSCSFATQWGIGLVVDAARARLGMNTAGGLKLAFVVVLILDSLTFLWFMRGWRRHSTLVRPAAATA